MPKKDIDFSRNTNYKIVCQDLAITDIYVGHTTEFTKRKSTHKYRCNNENKHYNILLYQTIRNNGGWENWSMIEIEKFCCNDVREAEARERYWIEELKSTLNSQIPSRTRLEYRTANQEHIKNSHLIFNKNNPEYYKDYYQANKGKLKEYKKEYYQKIKISNLII